MRPAALATAVLLGIATLGPADARATPIVSATIAIESERTVLVGGKRHHGRHDFFRGHAPRHGKGLVRHYKRHHHVFRHHGGRHHVFRHHGGHHRPGFVVKRFHKGPVVIVKPAWGRSFGYRHLPPRPLIKNGRFARGTYRW
jgi:hypothetical protein